MITPKIVTICAKCSDLCNTNIGDENGRTIIEHDGYVPSFMPDQGGDYVVLDIDIESGRILNWKKNAMKEVKEFIHKELDND